MRGLGFKASHSGLRWGIMEDVYLTQKALRSFLVAYQGLNVSKPKAGKRAILDYFDRVGTIQYDVLNILGRNADLVLQSRIKKYKPELLKELLYQDRMLIDGWDKVMSIYPAKDWMKFRRVRERQKESVMYSLAYRKSEKALDIMDEVVSIIEREGPLMAKDIHIGKAAKSTWGHGKLSSAALDYLFHIGDLGIHDKNHNHKKYDLITNLFSSEILSPHQDFENQEDFYRWYFKRRIDSIGIYWERNGDGWLGHFLSEKLLRSRVLMDLHQRGEILKVLVEGLEKETFYISQRNLELLPSLEYAVKKKVSFLAPLDNLIWDRKLIKQIFNFDYSWEVYVPKEKRKYGYYVLPVLYGDRFIARFEAEKCRPGEKLILKNWWWEDKVRRSKAQTLEIYKAMKRFCDYLGAERFSLEELDEFL